MSQFRRSIETTKKDVSKLQLRVHHFVRQVRSYLIFSDYFLDFLHTFSGNELFSWRKRAGYFCPFAVLGNRSERAISLWDGSYVSTSWSICSHYGHHSTGITSRDAKKSTLCISRGISLLTIPFWWNGQPSSLASSILELRPDLVNYIDKRLISSPIPTQIPEKFKSILQIFLSLSISALR